MHSLDIPEIISDLKYIKENIQQARNPIDFAIQLSNVMPWTVDYRERKHLLIFSPIQLVISLEDYGTATIFANTWHTLDFPTGMRIFATNQTSPVYAYIRATDDATVQDYNTVITSTIASPTGTPVSGTATPSSAVLTTAFNMGFNGTTWDPITETGGLLDVAEDNYSYTHISTNTTVTAKSGAGRLKLVAVNNVGGSWTITLFDNTSGSGAIIGAPNLNNGFGNTIFYGLKFTTGLTIVTSGTTPGDITVVWR